MENILEKLETLIDDIERDSQMTKDEIHDALVKLKVATSFALLTAESYPLI